MDLSRHIEANKNIIDPDYYHRYSELQDRRALASWKRHKAGREIERIRRNRINNESWNKRLNAQLVLPDEYYGTPEELVNENKIKNLEMLNNAKTPQKEDWSAFIKWLDNQFSKIDGISYYSKGEKMNG